jgi:hypothetical protein
MLKFAELGISFALVTALLFHLASTAASPEAQNWFNGSIEPTCAPYDGAAFEISAKGSDGASIRLTGMDSISKAEGTWAIALGAKPGSGEAALCDDRRPAESRCALGSSGSFAVKSTSDNRWHVEFSGTFIRGGTTSDVRGGFDAVGVKANGAGPLRCG